MEDNEVVVGDEVTTEAVVEETTEEVATEETPAE